MQYILVSVNRFRSFSCVVQNTSTYKLNYSPHLFLITYQISCVFTIIRVIIQHPDDTGSTHLWNVGLLQQDYTALHPRRLLSSYLPPWEPQISHGVSNFKISLGRFLSHTSQFTIQKSYHFKPHSLGSSVNQELKKINAEKENTCWLLCFLNKMLFCLSM
jgi:hypothetical protein